MLSVFSRLLNTRCFNSLNHELFTTGSLSRRWMNTVQNALVVAVIVIGLDGLQDTAKTIRIETEWIVIELELSYDTKARENGSHACAGLSIGRQCR